MKSKIKNAMLLLFALALIAATTVAITWALSAYDDMGKRENVFTPDDSVQLSIAEPWWDYLNENGKYEHTSGGVTTENDTEAEADVPSDYPTPSSIGLTAAEQGENLAARYLPGMLIPKNPKLYNMYTKATGDDDNTGAEYVAMTVSYKLLIPTQVKTGANIFTQASVTNVPTYWSAMNDFAAFTVDDNGTPSDTSDDMLSINMTYAQFNALAKVYSSTSASGFNTGIAVNNWTAFSSSDYTEGSAYYYNGVVYAKGSANLTENNTNPTENNTNPTAPLFSYVKINKFDGTTGEGRTVTLPDSDSDTATTSVKYELTVPNNNNGTTTLYLNTLPKFEIDLQGFAIDANVSEFKSGNDITALKDLAVTPQTNALDALKALINNANS